MRRICKKTLMVSCKIVFQLLRKANNTSVYPAAQIWNSVFRYYSRGTFVLMLGDSELSEETRGCCCYCCCCCCC